METMARRSVAMLRALRCEARCADVRSVTTECFELPLSSRLTARRSKLLTPTRYDPSSLHIHDRFARPGCSEMLPPPRRSCVDRSPGRPARRACAGSRDPKVTLARALSGARSTLALRQMAQPESAPMRSRPHEHPARLLVRGPNPSVSPPTDSTGTGPEANRICTLAH